MAALDVEECKKPSVILIYTYTVLSYIGIVRMLLQIHVTQLLFSYTHHKKHLLILFNNHHFKNTNK